MIKEIFIFNYNSGKNKKMKNDKTKLKEYYLLLPEFRYRRIQKLRSSFLKTGSGIMETFKYNMPTFEKAGNWVALANQKNYISVYFCSEELISDIKAGFPKLNTGKGCVRIKDNNELIVEELTKAFIKAMEYNKTDK